MVKRRYIAGSTFLLAVLLIAAVLILPKFAQTDPRYAYMSKIFDQSKVTTVDIALDDADLAAMLDDPTAENMYSATVVINGERLENVGVRTKGNSSLSSVARMTDSKRYSFKLDFNYEIDGQTLLGLKMLNLNNNFSDSTQMKEYLSYQMMEDMGVPTPAYSYMYVTINGEEWGLYLGVEAIDQTFVSRVLGDGTGDLYKPEGTGSDLKWISDDIRDYPGLVLKTNEGNSDQTAMIDMLRAINQGGDIEKYVDVDEMLRYFAVNTALVNLDSYQSNMKHNYYLYERGGVFSILPWDYNMSFGGFGGGPGGDMAGGFGGFGGVPGGGGGAGGFGGFGGGGGAVPDELPSELPDAAAGAPFNGADANGMPGAFPGGGFDGAGGFGGNMLSDATINFSITTPVSGTTLENSPLLNALLSTQEYREKFNRYLNEIATNLLDEDKLQAMTEQISSIILPYVEQDPSKFYTTEQFLEGISGDNSLAQFGKLRSKSILAQLSGDLVVEANTTGGFGGRPDGLGEGAAMPGDADGADGAAPDGAVDGGGADNPGGDNAIGGRQGPPGFGNGEAPGGNRGNNAAPGGNMPFPQRMDGGAGGDNRQPPGMNMADRGSRQEAEAVKATPQTILTTSISVILLLLFIGFMLVFKRRRV